MLVGPETWRWLGVLVAALVLLLAGWLVLRRRSDRQRSGRPWLRLPIRGHGSTQPGGGTRAAEQLMRLTDAPTPVVLVRGPDRARFLAEVSQQRAPSPWLGPTAVIEFGVQRRDPVADVLADVARLLGEAGLAKFDRFNRHLAAYRSRAVGRASRLETGVAVGHAAVAGAAGIVAGAAGAKLVGSEATGKALALATERFQGQGDLDGVCAAFVEDLEQRRTGVGGVVLVIDDLDAPSSGSGPNPLLPVLARLLAAGAIAVVASVGDGRNRLGAAFEGAIEYVARLDDDSVGGKLRAVGVPTELVDDLVQVAAGSPERLTNLLNFQEATDLDPARPGERETYLTAARAWADMGQVEAILRGLPVEDRRMILMASVLRHFNRPVLEQVCTAIGCPIEAAERLLGSDRRPSWLIAVDRQWQISPERLRSTILDEAMRTHPDLVLTTHRAATEYHRAEWFRAAGQLPPEPSRALDVPSLRFFRQEWDEPARRHQAEWVYHALAIDASAFAVVLDLVVVALNNGDIDAASTSVDWGEELVLPASQQYVVDLLRELVAATRDGQDDVRVRVLRQLLPQVSREGVAAPLLRYELGSALFLTQPAVAVRELEAAVIGVQGWDDDGWSCRIRLLADALIGAAQHNLGEPVEGGRRLQAAIDEADLTGDASLQAELRLTSTQRADLAPDEVVGILRVALRTVGATSTPRATASIRSSLALALMRQATAPALEEAERLLQENGELYEALGLDALVCDVLAYRHVLAHLQRRPEDAAGLRQQVLARQPNPAAAHLSLAHLMSWHDMPRAVTEYRISCTHDALRQLDRSATPTTPDDGGDPPAAPALDEEVLRQLLTRYAAELGPHSTSPSPSASPGSLEVTERTVIGWPGGDRSIRWFLGTAMRGMVNDLPAEECERHRVTARTVAHALEVGVGPSADPTVLLDLVVLFSEAGRGDEARAKLKALVADLEPATSGPDPDPELLSTLGIALVWRAHLEAGNAEQDRSRARELLRCAWTREPRSSRRLINYVEQVEDTEPATALQILAWELLRAADVRPGERTPGEDRHQALRAELLTMARRHDPSWSGEPPDEVGLVQRLAADDPELAEVVASWRATELRRRRPTSGTVDGLGADEQRPPPTLDEIKEAMRWFDRTVAAEGVRTSAVVAKAELLLDLGSLSPPGVCDPYDVLAGQVAECDGLTPQERLRIAFCLRRILTEHPDHAEAGDALRRLREIELREVAAVRRAQTGVAVPFVRPIRVLVGSAMVHLVDPDRSDEAAELYRVDGGMCDRLRDWLLRWSGFNWPPIVVSTHAEPAALAVEIGGIEVFRDDVPSWWAEPAGVVGANDRHEVGSSTLGETLRLSWIDEARWRDLCDRGQVSYDLRGLICLLLADLLPTYAAQLLDLQRLAETLGHHGWFERWRGPELLELHAAARRMLAAGTGLDVLARLVHDLDPTGPAGRRELWKRMDRWEQQTASLEQVS